MKKLILILLFPVMLSAQYIRAIQDTTGFPTTQLWEGRFIRVAGKFYEYQRGGWYSGNIYAMYHKDSLGGALKLTTPRNINGVAFDGTQDITITAAAVIDSTIWAKLWKLGLYQIKNDTTVAWRKMDSVRVNGLLALKMSAVSLIDSLIWNTVPQKMDSVRVNALRGLDTTRAIAREALKMSVVSLIDSLNWNTAPQKMDSIRALALRGIDTTRAVAREGLKLNTSAVKSGAYWDTTTITYGVVTIPAGDSIQVSITGVTATSVVTTAYRSPRMPADTMATWQIPANGKITIYGKYNKVIGYSVRR